MNRILPISIVAYLLLCSWAIATEKPFIDPGEKQIDEKIKSVTQECMKREKNPMKRLTCGDDLRKKYEMEGKIRGTDQYCELSYGMLTPEILKEKLKELRIKGRSARRLSALDVGEILPGEVLKEDFRNEEFWIESRLAQMQKARTDETARQLKRHRNQANQSE